METKNEAVLEMKPPVAEKVQHKTEIHGKTLIDDYFWMRLSEEQRAQKTPKPDVQRVLDHLNAENDYTNAVMADTEDFQKKLFDEIVGRIKQTDISVPYKYKGYHYYTRFEEGNEYPVYCRKLGSLKADEAVLLNVNELAEGFSYFHVAGRSISPNNELIAYGVDTLSRRIYTIKFKDLKTGEILKDEIPNTSGGCTWANDNRTVFYTVKDKALRSYKIFKHVLGADSANDEMVYHEIDDTFGTGIYKTKSEKYLVIVCSSTLSTEFRILNADEANGEFSIFQPRGEKHEYGIAHYGDKFYISTNRNAPNFKLMQCPEDKTSEEHWTEVIPHRDDVLLEDIDVFKDHLVVSERIEGLTQLRIKRWDGTQDEYLQFEDSAFTVHTGINPEFDTDELRIGYTSMTTPSSVFQVDMNSGEKELLKQQEVVGDFDKNDYHSERLMIEVRDGVKVPVSLVYKKGFEKNGQAPLLLYGYGSYGASMDPYFSSVRLSLLDRGFVFAIAHIRGGEEMGRHWYEDGKLFKKKNTFYDFIDCAKGLVAKNYTNPNKLYAMGGSAGGLLIGAVVNMAPAMFNGVVAQVPFVDVINTMLDESIPLTTGEFDEWGNPKIEEYFDYIMSYSPYDNVIDQDYPAMLITTGLHDSQVQYWEPAKWVAKLRDLKTDNNVLLLQTNMEAGHGGASGRFEHHKETALEYAFLLKLEGIME